MTQKSLNLQLVGSYLWYVFCSIVVMLYCWHLHAVFEPSLYMPCHKIVSRYHSTKKHYILYIQLLLFFQVTYHFHKHLRMDIREVDASFSSLKLYIYDFYLTVMCNSHDKIKSILSFIDMQQKDLLRRSLFTMSHYIVVSFVIWHVFTKGQTMFM